MSVWSEVVGAEAIEYVAASACSSLVAVTRDLECAFSAPSKGTCGPSVEPAANQGAMQAVNTVMPSSDRAMERLLSSMHACIMYCQVPEAL